MTDRPEETTHHTGRRAFFGLTGAAVVGAAVYSAFDGQKQAVASVTPGASAPQDAQLTPFRDPLRIPPLLRPRGEGVMEVELVAKSIRLHSQLPPTRMWTYAGHYPGPTIVAKRGQRVRIAWTSKLSGTSPVKGVWVTPDGPPPGLAPYNSPGSKGGIPRPEVAKLTPWTSVHLHGSHQHAVSDGSADYGVTPGHSQLVEYPNDMAAAHFFYHDHAMPITAINVSAGLMGNYFVRDQEEDRLGLPQGRYEIPLTISDVNFDTDERGRLTGQILVKRVALSPGKPNSEEFPVAVSSMGPYTMVNGVVWPHLEVEARCYRFRVVNTSVGRAYRLAVIDEAGKLVPGAMKLIGTDLGLLSKAISVNEALNLAPAERADILIDFAAFPGRKLRLVNTVEGMPAGTALPDMLVPRPEVMEFRVDKRKHSPYRVPATLSHDFTRLTASSVPADAVERFVMLTFDAIGMPVLWELQEVNGDTPPGDGIVQIKLKDGLRTFRRAATTFEDTTNFFAASASWEKWTFISVGPAENALIFHPMHIHLMNFQLLEKYALDASGMDVKLGGTKTPITLQKAIPIAPEESGWKDTVRVPGNSMVTVAGRFGTMTGRFMYHCHILDHEDEGMMRPLVVLPPAVLKVHHMMTAMHDKGAAAMRMPNGHH